MIDKIRWAGHALFQVILDCLFPPRCPICDQLLEDRKQRIHEKCRKQLRPVTDPVCFRCGRPVWNERDEFCDHCKAVAPDFHQGKALYEYTGPVKESVYRLKYQNRREYADFYAEQAVKMYGRWMKENHISCIVPVPMYRRKKRIRGYNQAETLASQLALKSGIPMDRKLIVRRVNTRPLKLYNEKERRRILKHAFVIEESRWEKKKCQNILIVDDIYTTGATVNEIARTIHKKYGKLTKIFVMTVCTPQRMPR